MPGLRQSVLDAQNKIKTYKQLNISINLAIKLASSQHQIGHQLSINSAINSTSTQRQLSIKSNYSCCQVADGFPQVGEAPDEDFEARGFMQKQAVLEHVIHDIQSLVIYQLMLT